MNLPVGVTVVTINGRLLNSDGMACIGWVEFKGSEAIRYTNSDFTLLPSVVSAYIDPSGYFSVVLPATNDTSANPINFTYSVVEHCPGGRSFWMSLPMAPAIVDYADVVAIPAGVGQPQETVYSTTIISICDGGTP